MLLKILSIQKIKLKKLIERERLIYDVLFKHDTSIGTDEHTQDDGTFLD